MEHPQLPFWSLAWTTEAGAGGGREWGAAPTQTASAAALGSAVVVGFGASVVVAGLAASAGPAGKRTSAADCLAAAR